MASRSDINSVFYSSSAYAGTSFSTNTATTGVFGAATNSDYANVDFGSGTEIRARVVASGLRVRYSATNLNRGGTVLGLITPNHNALNGLTFGVVDNYECSARFTPSAKWQTVAYCPVYTNELVYSVNLGSPGAGTPFPIMGFIVQSPEAGVAITFQYEFFTVIEVQGINVRGLVPSLADPNGFAAVQTTAQLSMMRPHDKPVESVASKMVKAAGHVASQTISGWIEKEANKGLKWIESEGATVLGGILSIF